MYLLVWGQALRIVFSSLKLFCFFLLTFLSFSSCTHRLYICNKLFYHFSPPLFDKKYHQPLFITYSLITLWFLFISLSVFVFVSVSFSLSLSLKLTQTLTLSFCFFTSTHSCPLVFYSIRHQMTVILFAFTFSKNSHILYNQIISK